MHRRASVDSIDQLQRLGLFYADNAKGDIPVPRPFLGGVNSGFHSAPAQADHVVVLRETAGADYSLPVATYSVASDSSQLFKLALGESIILHPDGRYAFYLKNDHTTTLLSVPNGCTISVDATNNVIVSTTGTITLTGNTTINGTLTVTQPLTLTNATLTNPTINGHVTATGSTVTAVLGANLGSAANGATATLTNANDQRGTINARTASSGASAGVLVTITYAMAYASVPTVVLSGGDVASEALNPAPTNRTVTGFQVSVATAPTASTGYSFTYIAMG